jgi:AraC family transcriptional regulator of adaptative response / DNA-3-methyladenine glycosylase II
MMARVSLALPDPVIVDLPVAGPFAADHLLAFLNRESVPGVEFVRGREYARSLRIGSGVDAEVGTIHLQLPGPGDRPVVRAALRFTRRLDAAIDRCRHLLDLDTDGAAVDRVLSADSGLRASVERLPGLRVPGTAEPGETMVRTILGQQVSVAGARTAATRLVALADDRLPDPVDGLTHLFPEPGRIAALGPTAFVGPRIRAQAVVTAAAAMADGRLSLDHTDGHARSVLLAMPGIGPWTADYLSMRIFGDPDVLLVDDLAVRRGAAALGLPDQPKDLAARGLGWRPVRSYAGMHLWAASG